MTGSQPAVESVVTVEHDGNVAYVVWHPTAPPPRPPVRHEPPAPGMWSGEEATSATHRRRAIPHLRRCWRRSQLRRDIHGNGLAIGLLGAVLVCAFLFPAQLAHLAHALFGGTR